MSAAAYQTPCINRREAYVGGNECAKRTLHSNGPVCHGAFIVRTFLAKDYTVRGRPQRRATLVTDAAGVGVVASMRSHACCAYAGAARSAARQAMRMAGIGFAFIDDVLLRCGRRRCSRHRV